MLVTTRPSVHSACKKIWQSGQEAKNNAHMQDKCAGLESCTQSRTTSGDQATQQHNMETATLKRARMRLYKHTMG